MHYSKETLHEQNMKQPVITAEILIGRDVIKQNAKILEGIIGIEQYVDENATITKKVLDSYRAKYGEVAWPFYQAAIRDAVVLVTNAIAKHGTDTAQIKNELYATKDFEGAVGKLTIDSNGDAILKLAVRQVKAGKVVDVE